MMKRGFALTLMMVAIALANVSTTHATAPVISDPGDVVIGDLEDRSGTSPNVFVSPDAIEADNIVSDDTTPDNQIKWSFTAASTAIRINGVVRLSPTLAGLDDDDPTSPRALSRLDLNTTPASPFKFAENGGPLDVADSDPRTFTFRNSNLSPDNTSVVAGADGTVLATNTVTLFASDCSTFGQRTILVWTIKGESDSLSGGGPEIVKTVDFTTTTDGWIGGNQAGFGGTVSSGASGLCMTVPPAGTNIVLWLSPEEYVELVDNAVYRIRTGVTTSQTTVDAIPLWFSIFTNSYYLTGGGNGGNYGAFAWVLDVDGGAQGIGRANGRTTYDFWHAPNSVATPQWSAGAFTVAADALNDAVLRFDIIDGNPALLTQNDSGTICIANLEVGRLDRGSIQVASSFDAPIASTTHAFATTTSLGTATATISGGAATIDPANSGVVRRDLIYFDPEADGVSGPQFGNLEIFPVVWAGDTLYRGRFSIRAQTSEADQVDALFLAFDTPNSELGVQSYTLRTGGSVMNGAASPKLAAAEYEAYFFGQNATDSLTPNANRTRAYPFIFNTDTLFGTGNGGDALVIDGFAIDTLNN
jgi:hypothetical protein